MKKVLSTMAIMLAICLVTALCFDFASERMKPQNEVKNGIEYFSNEAELLDYMEEHFVNRNYYSGLDFGLKNENFDIIAEEPSVDYAEPEAPTAPMSPNAPTAEDSSAEDDHSETNVQVDGVDEGDILKTDGNFIYIVQSDIFTIVDITGEKPVKAASVDLTKNENSSAYIIEMYIKGDNAILIYNFHENGGGYKIYTPSSNYTTVAVYDISDRTNPVEVRNVAFEGSLISSREMDGKLYLVTNKYFYRFYDTMPKIDDVVPIITDSIAGDCTPEACEIAKCIWPEPSTNIMTIAIVDYLSEEQPETLHILGSGSNINMKTQNRYVFSSGWDGDNGSYTEIAKYSIKDGINCVGTAKAPGYAATQFSYDEYNGKFRIATTTSVYNGSKHIDTNNIYVYDETMTLCGSLTGLAPDESIKSARFMGDTAYLVTFRQVDPLFVIDMSENDPKVVGELKIPGFSTYLHPVGEGLLLGIGSETVDNIYDGWVSTSVSGLKVSLFDVSDPANPTELDVASYVGGKNAYSVAKDNHNAFVYSAKTNTGYFPITVYDDMWNNTDTLAEVRITDGNLDVRVAELTKVYGYYSESRVCYSGDYLYLLRNCSLTKLDRETLEFISDTELNIQW